MNWPFTTIVWLGQWANNFASLITSIKQFAISFFEQNFNFLFEYDRFCHINSSWKRERGNIIMQMEFVLARRRLKWLYVRLIFCLLTHMADRLLRPNVCKWPGKKCYLLFVQIVIISDSLSDYSITYLESIIWIPFLNSSIIRTSLNISIQAKSLWPLSKLKTFMSDLLKRNIANIHIVKKQQHINQLLEIIYHQIKLFKNNQEQIKFCHSYHSKQQKMSILLS